MRSFVLARNPPTHTRNNTAVHKTTDVHNGQVVVARVDEDVTVKRLEKRGREVLLHAENDEFSPIKVDLASEPFSIEGIAVGVIRNADWM